MPAYVVATNSGYQVFLAKELCFAGRALFGGPAFVLFVVTPYAGVYIRTKIKYNRTQCSRVCF